MTPVEINRVIAEKVFGLEIETLCGIEYFKENPSFIWCQPANTFNPAERIDHAWMIVDKLDLFSIGYLHKLNVTKEWIFASKDQLGKILGKANTAPMAISLAALEAVNVTVE